MFRKALIHLPMRQTTGLGTKRVFFHSARVTLFNKTPSSLNTSTSDAPKNVPTATTYLIKIAKVKTFEKFDLTNKSKVHGSYHWILERGLSVATLPIIGAAFVFGSNPLIDFALAIVIPWHCHLGFQVILDDYLPKRRNPTANAILLWSLRAGTLLVFIGCFQFNINDVGLTALTKRIWTQEL